MRDRQGVGGRWLSEQPADCKPEVRCFPDTESKLGLEEVVAAYTLGHAADDVEARLDIGVVVVIMVKIVAGVMIVANDAHTESASGVGLPHVPLIAESIQGIDAEGTSGVVVPEPGLGTETEVEAVRKLPGPEAEPHVDLLG